MRYSILYFIILISLTIFGCINQSISNNNNDFENYTKNIPLINLPYSTTCGSCCTSVKLTIDSILLQKYNFDNLEIVGKIVVSDNYVAILYAGAADYYVPVLIIYDSIGNRISNEQFMGHDICGQNLDSYGTSFLYINEKLQITEKDTSLLFKMDTISYTILDTIKKDIKSYIFQIDNDGKIVKINAS